MIDFARLLAPAGALLFCAAVEPENAAGPVFCPFRLITGLPCPFCGMTRGVACLLRGKPVDAFTYHAFSPFVFTGLLAWLALEAGRYWGWWRADRLFAFARNPAPWLTFLVVCSVYTVLRWCGIIDYSRI
ncbi:MAG: DUF2752 domain-containing protein [Acidobacteria bacterium]|nr:DUF2752 domain-containing protein [Acidobacteriota bacterium]